MTKKTPLQQVKDRFGSKEKLVAELKAMFEKGKAGIQMVFDSDHLVAGQWFE